MRPSISIVVPVYKVENYLSHCIESLINQTYRNIEVILIDDGSPDRCSEMCDSYSKKDPRVKALHKRNGGLSDARNVGLLKATGEFVLFVDSDDYIALDTCEELLKGIKQDADIVVGGANRIEDNQITQMKRKEKQANCIMDSREFLKCELRNRTMYMPVWMNLYRRNFLLENRLFFEQGLFQEDELWTPQVFLKAGLVVDSQCCFYFYMIRDGSITNGGNKLKNAEDSMNICKTLEKIYREIEDKELRLLLNDKLVNEFLNSFQTADLHKKEYSHLVDKQFLIGKAFTLRNKLRVFLFLINKKLYYYLNKFSKDLKKLKLSV